MSDLEKNAADLVDRVSRRKAGKLAAHGLSERQIADALLLTEEQVVACKKTEEYIAAYTEQVREKIETSIDLEEGWDGVEKRALAHVFEAMEYNRNPKFSLTVAAVANKAKRRTPSGQDKPIDTTRIGNVIQITVNKIYAERAVINGEIPVEKRSQLIEQRKISDIPTPQAVHTLLEQDKDESQDRNNGEININAIKRGLGL